MENNKTKFQVNSLSSALDNCEPFAATFIKIVDYTLPPCCEATLVVMHELYCGDTGGQACLGTIEMVSFECALSLTDGEINNVSVS